MEVEASGDLGYFWGTYRLTATPKAGGKSSEEAGKAVFIVKRDHAGAWKIARLIDSRPRADQPVMVGWATNARERSP